MKISPKLWALPGHIVVLYLIWNLPLPQYFLGLGALLWVDLTSFFAGNKR